MHYVIAACGGLTVDLRQEPLGNTDFGLTLVLLMRFAKSTGSVEYAFHQRGRPMISLQKIATEPAVEMVGVADNRAQCDELRSNAALALSAASSPMEVFPALVGATTMSELPSNAPFSLTASI